MNTPLETPTRGVRGSAAAFTLIEVLVVVGLLALFAAMLAPALGRTNPSPKGWQCMNNLRQWSIATRLYASDNLDAIPRDGFDHNGLWPGSDGAHADGNAWFNLLPPYLSERTLKDYWNDPGSDPMLKLPFPGGKGKSWHCSSASMSSADVALIWGGGAEGFFSYDMNADLKKQTADIKTAYPLMPKVAAFPKPSATVVFFDCAFNPRTDVVNGSPQWNSVNPANRWTSFSARHGDGGTFAFLDGHARVFSADYVTNGASTYEALRPDIIWNPPYRIQNP